MNFHKPDTPVETVPAEKKNITRTPVVPLVPWPQEVATLLIWHCRLLLSVFELYINGNKQHVYLWVWLISLNITFMKFIHAGTCNNSLFILIEYSMIYLSALLLMHFGVAFCSGLLWIVLLWTFLYMSLVNICVHFCWGYI